MLRTLKIQSFLLMPELARRILALMSEPYVELLAEMKKNPNQQTKEYPQTPG